MTYRGLVFHVQTEDSGVANPHIFTHLFHGGVIISTRKLTYDPEAADDVVKSLMQAQHKAVLKGLKRGEFDSKIDEYLGSNPDLEPAMNDAERARAEAEASAKRARARTTTGSRSVTARLPRTKSGPIRNPSPVAPAPPPVPSGTPRRHVTQTGVPPIPTSKRPATTPPPAARTGGSVLVSRPPIVVDSKRQSSRASSPRTARLAPKPTVREETQDGIFDQNLISEKSLDEVILAYLSEDSSDD